MGKNKGSIDIATRASAFTELAPWCTLAKPDDFLEVTEWLNGEGYDICVSAQGRNFTVGLTAGEFDAVKKLIKALNKRDLIVPNND